MRRGTATRFVTLALLAACRAPSALNEADLTPGAATALAITLAKGSWTWDEVSGPQASGIRATIRNISAGDVTSALGDAFNAAAEQADLYLAAESGGGAVEWRDASGSWQPAGLAYLVEGAKSVLLRSGGSYPLTTLLQGPQRTGTYRIRIDFYEAPDGAGSGGSVGTSGTARHSDYSASFEIR